MQRWTAAAAAELGVPGDLLPEVGGALLDLVRDVAHGVSRPAAPLSAFLVGVAARAAAAGGPAPDAAAPDAAAPAGPAPDAAAVRAAVDRLRALAAGWPPPPGG
ncbi:DUF6457 domain-containing protein [Cellulomonas sp.]|uniref:DUF6457 domain-containing protein n=1 Tax=Cellulomonas sp. TaxID=40001 RepID=UPI002D67AA5F|nr:DUF6457 domain-containing protein [Cellulomonas sp.]HYQ76129.1 DUF6457 domain-containing protein [Cellulomonas sp.]